MTPTRAFTIKFVAVLVLLFTLPVAFVVLPLRTLVQIELVTTQFARGSASFSVELLDQDGDPSRPRRVDSRGGSIFTYGTVHAVRVARAGCKARTFKLDDCSKAFHFTDYHRYLHHGSASHYELDCKVEVTLDCD